MRLHFCMLRRRCPPHNKIIDTPTARHFHEITRGTREQMNPKKKVLEGGHYPMFYKKIFKYKIW